MLQKKVTRASRLLRFRIDSEITNLSIFVGTEGVLPVTRGAIHASNEIQAPDHGVRARTHVRPPVLLHNVKNDVNNMQFMDTKHTCSCTVIYDPVQCEIIKCVLVCHHVVVVERYCFKRVEVLQEQVVP
jgi:hypothetical protein